MEFKGAGGTSGGLGEFFAGCGMAGIGAYQILSHIRVSTSFHVRWFGSSHGSTGSVLGVFFLGLFLIFFNGRSKMGWLMVALSLLAIAYSVLANLDIYYQSQTMLTTLVTFGLLAGGLGLVLRSLTPHGD